MGDFSQVLVCVLLLGEWVLAWVAVSDDFGEMAAIGSGDLQLEKLTFSGTLDQSTLDLEGSAYVGFLDLFITFNVLGYHYLYTLIARIPT